MEGLLYGLFTLLGVLAGGLFTYLGMKKQLEQQRVLDSRQWRRKVRSEPLLKLRDALALMATKLEKLVTNTKFTSTKFTEEVENKESQRALDDYMDYITSGQFLPTLYLQYYEELLKLVEEIESAYMLLFEYALDYKNLSTADLKIFREISLKIKNKIPEVQELIYKQLEGL